MMAHNAYSDSSGNFALLLAFGIALTVGQIVLILVTIVVVVFLVMEMTHDFYYTDKIMNLITSPNSVESNISLTLAADGRSLLPTGIPNSTDRLYGRNGNLKQKRWYDDNGLALRDRDYEHQLGDYDFPHDHEWQDGIKKGDHLDPDYDNFPDDNSGESGK